MNAAYRAIRAFLGRCYARVRFSLLTQRARLKNIERFHVMVSDVVNTTVERLDHNESEILELQHKIRKLEQFLVFSDEKAKMRNDLAQLPEIDYVAFENAFRGSEDLIKQRQSLYVEYFLNCKSVLDVGCGRGEFLELLAEKNIDAVGVDLDTNMCNYCLAKDLQVVCTDVFKFLLTAEDNTFDGVFSAQVIEHLEFSQLQNLLLLLQKKIMPGAKVLLETVNPLCQVAYQHFYMDLTHVKPLFPEVVTFIAESFGLKKHALLFRTPIVEGLPDTSTDITQAHLYGDYALVLEK